MAFHIPFSKLSAFDDCRLADSTYLATVAERDSKWERLVQLGPMTRSEYWDCAIRWMWHYLICKRHLSRR